MARKQYNVSSQEFVKVWQECRTADEVAERTGLPKGLVYARASAYRKRGVRLKRLERSNSHGLDLDKLQALVEATSIAPQQARFKLTAEARAVVEQAHKMLGELLEKAE